MANGDRITSARQWRARRVELIEQFRREMYGQAPPRPAAMRFLNVERVSGALGGAAVRKQVTIAFTGDPAGPKVELLVYLPAKAKGQVPVILGMNFWGNQEVSADPGIRLTTGEMESGRSKYVDLSCVKDHHATEACRGINARQWPIEKILARGYALATFYCIDIHPDEAGHLNEGLFALYPELQDRGDNFAVIGAWAWALSRAMDYLETDREIDKRRVAAFGWSRLGKAALWAAATDERFAMAISNESGAGGAKLFHRGVGESVRQLNTNFPHWYCANFRKYNDLDTSLPFDQHEMIALIAPRPVYVASAQDDREADPLGEFQAAKAAEPVYRLLGKEGLPTGSFPAVNQAVFGQIGYHVRAGRHDVTEFDWTQYLRFLDERMR